MTEEFVSDAVNEAFLLVAAFTTRGATGHIEIHISGGIVREVKTFETHKIRETTPNVPGPDIRR